MSSNHSRKSSSIRSPRTFASDDSLDPISFAPYPDCYGVFAWWPDDRNLGGEGEQWLHPYDEVLAADYLPSDRVWQRFRGEGMFDLYCQGEIRFRAQPRMWIEVGYEGYWIGDFVELLSQQGERDPFVAEISDVRWNRQTRELEYLLNRAGHMMVQRFSSREFRTASALDEKDSAAWRPPQLNPREEIRLKPDESDPSWIDLEPL
jgi:hypothetical protein